MGTLRGCLKSYSGCLQLVKVASSKACAADLLTCQCSLLKAIYNAEIA